MIKVVQFVYLFGINQNEMEFTNDMNGSVVVVVNIVAQLSSHF